MTHPTITPATPASPMFAASARLIADAVARAATHAGGPTLSIDLGGVAAPTAACLGRLVALERRLRAAGRRLVLVNVGELAYEVFSVTRLVDLLDVRRAGECDDTGRACAAA
jgi:anti-anti-sigma regulatory factor